ncbi:hypothetical protein JCM3775_006224 [Rhodotorula graminis]
MPAPRPPAQSRARKSTVPDPDLYGDDPDPSSDDQPPPPKRAKPAPPASKQLSRRGSKGPQPVRGTVIADNGRRRSTRLSNEHAPDDDDLPVADSSSSRANNASTSAPARKPKPLSKAKKRLHRDDRSASDPDDAADEPDQPPAPAPSRSKSSAKRPRVAPGQDADDDNASSSRATAAAPVASSSSGAPPAPAPARRGFVPRAVADLAQRVNKPPPTYAAALVDDDDDAGDGAADPFPFTTNPPTPHAKKKSQGAAGGKAASAAKGKGKGKAPRVVQPASPTSDAEDDNAAGSDSDVTPDSAALPPSHAAAASTSARRARPDATPPRAQGRHPLPHDAAAAADGRASVHVHETPVQVKNIAFRAGAGPGTPATVQRTMSGSGAASARRNSVRGSATRGSSIGGGFDAVPHPQVADDKLYRSTDASDPLAKRLRALLSWASQRTRGRVLAPSGLGDKGEGDEVERAAREIVDSWVDDVCRLKVDTSVPFSEPSASQDPATLPPHPQNEANAARLGELEAAYAAIAQEQARRHALEPTYQAFFDRRSAAHDAAPAPQRAWDDPVKMARTLDTSSTSLAATDPPLSALPLSSLADARALGQRVLAGDLSLAPSSVASPSPATDRPEIQRALVGTAQLAHVAHRLEGFVRAASAYVRHRGKETHAVLGQLGAGAAAPGAAAAGGEGAGLAAAAAAAAVGGAAAGSSGGSTQAGAGVDARDLLRAIAGADTARR